MRAVASFMKKGFSTRSSTEPCIPRSFSLMSVRVAIRHKRNRRGRRTLANGFYQLATIEPGHLEVGDDQVGHLVDGFEQCVRAIRGCRNRRQFGQLAPKHIQHHRIIVNEQNLEIASQYV